MRSRKEDGHRFRRRPGSGQIDHEGHDQNRHQHHLRLIRRNRRSDKTEARKSFQGKAEGCEIDRLVSAVEISTDIRKQDAQAGIGLRLRRGDTFFQQPYVHVVVDRGLNRLSETQLEFRRVSLQLLRRYKFCGRPADDCSEDEGNNATHDETVFSYALGNPHRRIPSSEWLGLQGGNRWVGKSAITTFDQKIHKLNGHVRKIRFQRRGNLRQ